MKTVLVVDVGGTHVKFRTSQTDEVRKFDSDIHLTAQRMVEQVNSACGDWTFDVVTVGVPAPIIHGQILHDPHNLGPGWVGFDFQQAFGKPTKLINDAAMQALGDYNGGSMLFLGLGTGLGSAMIVNGELQPMELAHLPYKAGKTYEEVIGDHGLKHHGQQKWQKSVADVVELLRNALEADEVVIGGGNVRLLEEPPPPHTRYCSNNNAFQGGFRLWEGIR